jgi:hypothetical protein
MTKDFDRLQPGRTSYDWQERVAVAQHRENLAAAADRGRPLAAGIDRTVGHSVVPPHSPVRRTAIVR